MATREQELRTVAERKIATILQEFEQDTGQIVECIEVVDELTSLYDNGQRWRRHVRIDLKRRPGIDWAV